MKNIALSTCFLFCFSASNALADIYAVVQSLPDLNRVVVKCPGGCTLRAGDILLAKSIENKSCSLIILEVKDEVVNLDSSRCSFKNDIKVGDSLEKSLISLPVGSVFDGDSNKVGERANSNNINNQIFETSRISISVYYALADTVKFSDSTIRSGSTAVSGSAEYMCESAFGVGFSVGKIPNKNFGYLLSGHYQLPRKMKGAKFSAQGDTQVSSLSGSSTISYLFGEGAGVFRSDQFYFPLGLNFALGVRKDGGTGTSSTAPGIGYVIGVGLILYDNLSFEFLYRSLGYQETGVAPNNVSYDFGTGYLGGFNLSARYWF